MKYYLPKLVEDKQIFLVLFNLVFRFFMNVEKYIRKVKRCFGTLLYSFMFDFASMEGGRGGWGEH